MSKRFIALLLGLFVIIGAAFFFVLRWGSQLPTPREASAPPAPPPPAPVPPSVTLAVIKEAKGNLLLIRWANLPCNATALDIFRSKKGKNNWSLWEVIKLAAGQCAGGSAKFNIGKSDFSTYSFYVEAVTGGGGGGPINPQGETILWISSSTTPGVTTSSLPSLPEPGPGPGGSPTSTPPAPTPSSSPSSSGGNPSAPTGTPYYTPEIQISGYGLEQAGSFWVQHIDQRIQIGWKNLPSQATSIVVYRSGNQGGPWTTVLRQENPAAGSEYSIQVVDDTLGAPYYYQMSAFAGSSTLATYGPIYLPPVGQ
jgi:hypothetical protein